MRRSSPSDGVETNAGSEKTDELSVYVNLTSGDTNGTSASHVVSDDVHIACSGHVISHMFPPLEPTVPAKFWSYRGRFVYKKRQILNMDHVGFVPGFKNALKRPTSMLRYRVVKYVFSLTDFNFLSDVKRLGTDDSK